MMMTEDVSMSATGSSAPALENRTPRPKACTFCRSSKHRCDGKEGELSCSRCVRNLRKCTWPERKQMGRKPKNPKRQVELAAQRQEEMSESPTFQDLSSPSTSSSFPLFSSASSSGGWGFDLGTSMTPDPMSLNLHELPAPSAKHLPLADVAANSFFERSTSQPASTPAASVASESSASSIENLSSLSELGDVDTLMKLIDIFYSVPHLYVPVVAPKDEFFAEFGQTSSLLLNSMFALAATYASFPIPTDYRTIAIGQLESYNIDTMEPFSNESIQYMQALLILLCLEFGAANVEYAVGLMKRACNFAVLKGWNTLDAVRPDTSTSTVTLNRDGPLIRRGLPTAASSPMPDDALSRRIRIIWWECWSSDIVMSVTCRQQRFLHGVLVQVNLPTAPALYREPGCPIVWHYPLRVRVLTILVEAIGFPACQDDNQRQQQAERFFTFDTLIDNLMMEANLAWADCMKVVTGYSGHLASTPLGLEAAIGKELYFMSILMLHSASVHLHHLYAMPEVNFDLKVCGITTGFALLELQQTNATEEYTENVFRPSLSKIVNASRALMGLMRSAHKSSVLAMTSHTLPSTGMYSQMYTPRKELGAGGGGNVEDSLAVTEDILRHSPFCACSQVVAAFGAALEVATAGSKWQAMAAESNFDTSKMVLQRLKRVWPVAAVFEDELDKCHGAVQGALQLW